MISKDVLVIGAGIGGLSFASFAQKRGRNVTVLEQAPSLGPVGAGLLLPPAGQDALEELGLLSEIREKSAFVEGVDLESAPAKPIAHFSYDKLQDGLHALGTPRHVLFESLRKSAEDQGVKIISNAKVQSITPHSPTQAIVKTDAGEEYSAALVVVADGSKSPHGRALGLRRAGFQYSHEAIFITGELDNLRQNRLIQRKEGTRLTGLLPIGAGQASFFWGLSQDDPFLSGSQFEREANSLIPEASKLIRKLSTARSVTRVGYRCSMHYPWYFNNIVLLGDAAHAMTPHLGQGASLALQDAQSLAKAIGQKQGKLEDALNDYQKERFFITSYYSLVSSLSAPYFQSDFSALGAPGNLALKSLKRIAGLERLMLSTMSGFGPMLKNLERAETTNSFSSSPI